MAINGKEAIKLLDEEPFDIVLMDLQMPEMDGFTTIEYIRAELHNNIPIIALTAGVFVEDYERCERLGANACISKPVNQTVLCDLILNLTNSSKGK